MVRNNNIYFLIYFVLNFSFLFSQSEKCGTFKVVERYFRNASLKITQRQDARPILQKNVLTRTNKFRIHYDTIGINQPAMVDISGIRIPNSFQQFVDTLSIILDSVWNAEVNIYNFTPPPEDNGRGGGPEYDFYITNFTDGTFGLTNIEFDLPVGTTKINQQYASFIQIDNDFGIGYRSKGVQAIMATSAHEFHHAIQVGGSGVWEGNYFYFYELCAEAMENTVFKDAKDYIFDVRTYFKNISSTPLFQQRVAGDFETAGYERALWGIFLMKKYGTNIMREIWEKMKDDRPVQACSNALNVYSTSIQREFADFTFWNFYTGYRADTSKYYHDALLFPSVSITRSVNVTTASQNIQFTTKSFAANYIKASTTTDSAFVIVSNTNLLDAINYTQGTFPFQISVSSSSSSGLPQISNLIFAKFQVENYSDWSYNAIGSTQLPVCFPNPFNPNKSSLLIALTGIQRNDHIQLNIYSASSMDLIFSSTPKFKTFSGIQYAEWEGRDNHGELASSGIYLFVISNGIELNKGKFAIIR